MIYAMKKTVFIGAFSTFQLIAILILNFVLIPKFGVYGPIISIGVINMVFAIYSWAIVIKHYWGGNKNLDKISSVPKLQ